MKTSKAELIKKSHLLVSNVYDLLEQATMEYSNVSRRPDFDEYLNKAQKATSECKKILSNLTRFSEVKENDQADINVPDHLAWIFDDIDNSQKNR